jgi:ligand-binding SRPBCC domain-containing protein
MRIHEFETSLWLPRLPDEAFRFFAEAANLNAITPPWLHFRMITPLPVQMKVGALIDYRLRVRLVTFSWRTCIRVWDPPVRFVDEQIRGPYSRWIHKHEFEKSDTGTVVRDHVEYATPLDFLLHKLLVRPDIERIFAFRARALAERFNLPETRQP